MGADTLKGVLSVAISKFRFYNVHTNKPSYPQSQIYN